MLAANQSTSSLSWIKRVDVMYDLRGLSNALRLSKHRKVVGMYVDPVAKRTAALILSDCRLLYMVPGVYMAGR